MSGFSSAGRLSLAVAMLVFANAESSAQEAFKTFKQLDSSIKMPKLNAFSVPMQTQAPASAAKIVSLEARLTSDGNAMQQGLSWRVFSPIPGGDGKLPMLASAEGGTADFELLPGDYFVNVTFGRAGTTKKLTIPQSGDVEKQVLVLDAGGMMLNAISGTDSRIPAKDLSFKIYASEMRDDGERGLVMDDVKPATIVRLNAGSYHIVSEYGDVNAVVRADIKVEAGKLTEAVMQHRAAQINLKLVSEEGGEAIADTAWSVLTSAGDIVNESVSAFPIMILAEGEYTAIARNKEKIYQRDFTVSAGRNDDVELLMKDPKPQESVGEAVD
ncbi:MAG: hypothetical protein ACOH2J_07810 [Allorhizobium sp.]